MKGILRNCSLTRDGRSPNVKIKLLSLLLAVGSMEAEESRVVVTLIKQVSALARNGPFQRREADVGSVHLVALTGFMRGKGLEILRGIKTGDELTRD